jgi:hypothetical protein
MTHWTASRTTALASAEASLKTVESLLSFVKEGQGKPSTKERAIFAAAVVFLYGIWENFVEQLAIEVASNLAKEIKPEKIPDLVKRNLEKRSAWELAISPGWRTLWVQTITAAALGDDDEKFGLNTANTGQVTHLLANAGVPDALTSVSGDIIPDHLSASVKTAADAVNELVRLRGEIVHTGQVPAPLRKAHVRDWESFVSSLCEAVDLTCRTRCKALTP